MLLTDLFVTFTVAGMSKLKLGELFAGYGGLGMAVEHVLNAELTWYAEYDDAPSKVMAHHWPGVPNHRDVSKVDWSQVEPVDIISGGSPCQDLSTAGRRAGMTDGTRSNLWVSMREAIATIKPKYVVWENVRGAFSAGASSEMEQCAGCMGTGRGASKHALRALGRVLGDLSDLGYDAEWRSLRASDVGAPHARYRVFILATRRGAKLADTLGERSRKSLGRKTRIEGAEIPQPHHWRATTTDTNSAGSRGGYDAPGESKTGGQDDTPIVASSDNCRPWPIAKWGTYGQAIARWQGIHGEAPAPVELSATGKYRLNAEFAEWMMGLAPGHVTAVPGLKRSEQIKAIGNGVVPQQAIYALEMMMGQR